MSIVILYLLEDIHKNYNTREKWMVQIDHWGNSEQWRITSALASQGKFSLEASSELRYIIKESTKYTKKMDCHP